LRRKDKLSTLKPPDIEIRDMDGRILATELRELAKRLNIDLSLADKRKAREILMNLKKSLSVEILQGRREGEWWVKKIYFDSSVYIKAFSKEPGTDVVNQLLQLAYDGRLEILLSVWAINETFAAIDRDERRVRRKEIASEQEKMIFATFFQEFVTW
jgi:hypothetical protein